MPCIQVISVGLPYLFYIFGSLTRACDPTCRLHITDGVSYISRNLSTSERENLMSEAGSRMYSKVTYQQSQVATFDLSDRHFTNLILPFTSKLTFSSNYLVCLYRIVKSAILSGRQGIVPT